MLAINLLAMDFSRAGAVEALASAFRARVRWRQDGHPRVGLGPRRPQREAAEEDLESMRATARGMGRAEGFAAMEAEANRLKEGKAPTEPGSVILFGDSFAACIKWDEAGTVRRAYGPRRTEKRRAEEDLEALREASSGQADPAERRAALAAER